MGFNPVDIVLLAILVLIIGGAIVYIVRAKKRGVKCIGCPAAGGKCTCNCGSNKADTSQSK